MKYRRLEAFVAACVFSLGQYGCGENHGIAKTDESPIDYLEITPPELQRRMAESPDLLRRRFSHGKTLLHLASGDGLAEHVAALLASGAAVDAKAADGATPLLTAVQSIRISDKPNPADRYGEVVAGLLTAGADPNIVSKNELSPLHVAVRWGYSSVARQLIEAGADPNLPDQSGQTPLFDARQYEIAEMLVDAGAEVGFKSESGLTPLHVTATPTIAKLLLANGARLEAKVLSGTTPLVFQADLHPSVATVLVESGADVNARDGAKRTALHRAAGSGAIGLARLLIREGADLEARSDIGMTPLVLASYRGMLSSVKMLLGAGADLESKDIEGWTALDYARWRKADGIVKLLESHDPAPHPEPHPDVGRD